MKIYSLVTKILLVSFAFSISIYGQQKDRTIKRNYWRNEPIKIINIRVKNTNINFKEKFLEDDEWLRDFSVQVENISNQSIVFLEILLSFPQDKNGMPKIPAAETLRYGVMPLPTGERPSIKLSEPPLLPEETATLKLDNYEALKGLLDYAGHDKSVQEVTISIGRVVFADGRTMWNGGQLFNRDKTDPESWLLQQKESVFPPNDKLNFFLPLIKPVSFSLDYSDKYLSTKQSSSVLPNKISLKSSLFLPAVKSDFCQMWEITNNKQCNNYACHVVNHGQGQPTGSPTKGYKFREETVRCIRNDNGEDCFAFNTRWIVYFDCSLVGGGGCLSGLTTLGEEFKENDSSNICSPCDPDPSEVIICQQNGGTYDYSSCQCGQSPIVIDVSGNGFNLTNAVNGIQFDINGDGVQDQVAWSSANSDDAWLALDRNGNSLIDSGKELFGNSTRQPAPPAGTPKNGFLALAVFDRALNGGNEDGKITNLDAVFANLRLWQDVNHNGISEASELKALGELGLAVIDLDYQESRRSDEHGNRFRYAAKVRDMQGAQIGRWAWDVYLVTQHSDN